MSVLEHVEKADVAIRNMLALLNPGGHLVATFPYKKQRYVRNVYELAGSSYGKGLPYIAQGYSRAEPNRWLENGQGAIVDQEYWQFWDGDFWTIGAQVIPPNKVRSDDRYQLSCVMPFHPAPRVACNVPRPKPTAKRGALRKDKHAFGGAESSPPPLLS